MIKKICFILLILLSLSIVACSKTTESGADKASVTSQNITKYGAPERKYDLQGQVKIIRGNEISVNKIVGEQLELTEEEKLIRQEERKNLSPEEKQQIKEQKTEISDETTTFIVPIGVPIISTQNIGGNPEAKQMDLADIQKGSSLKIWFKADSQDSEAEFIQLMNTDGI